jgi:hypothetical protein
MRPIISHARLEPGRFSTPLGCAGRKDSVEKSLAYWQRKAAELGPHCGRWAGALAERRGAQAMRVLQGLCSLHRKHPSDALDSACQSALSREAWKLKEIKTLLTIKSEQKLIPFIEEHELIRPLQQYEALVPFPHAEETQSI